MARSEPDRGARGRQRVLRQSARMAVRADGDGQLAGSAGGPEEGGGFFQNGDGSSETSALREESVHPHSAPGGTAVGALR